MKDKSIKITAELAELIAATAAHCGEDVDASRIFRAAARRVAAGRASAGIVGEIAAVSLRDRKSGMVVQYDIKRMYYRAGNQVEKVRNLLEYELTGDEFRAVVAAVCYEALAAPAAPVFPEFGGAAEEGGE
ncbi:MAG: hypothetical protein AB7F40_11410 [Victivallaceae bacterium]